MRPLCIGLKGIRYVSVNHVHVNTALSLRLHALVCQHAPLENCGEPKHSVVIYKTRNSLALCSVTKKNTGMTRLIHTIGWGKQGPVHYAMMTSSIWNIIRVTGLLCGEFTGHRWIPLTRASDAELWYILWSALEQTVEQAIETPVIWDAIALIMTSL